MNTNIIKGIGAGLAVATGVIIKVIADKDSEYNNAAKSIKKYHKKIVALEKLPRPHDKATTEKIELYEKLFLSNSKLCMAIKLEKPRKDINRIMFMESLYKSRLRGMK